MRVGAEANGACTAGCPGESWGREQVPREPTRAWERASQIQQGRRTRKGTLAKVERMLGTSGGLRFRGLPTV